MKNLFLNKKCFFMWMLGILFANISYAVTIKVAILDNLRSQKLASIKYEADYLAGVQTAALAAKKYNVHINYKYFKYGREPLDILKVLPELKSWAPDYIIGPRSSNKFLLLKFYFNDVAVVSPLASANEIINMPTNFHSLNSSDSIIADAIDIFINKSFREMHKIFILSAIDCKSCYDIGRYIVKNCNQRHPHTQIALHTFFADKVEKIDISKIMMGYVPGDIIVIPNLSYVSAVLIARITSYLKSPDIVFIGGDGWASSQVAYVGKLGSKTHFIAYHLSQWPLNIKTKEVESFKRLYHELFGETPNDTISYATYITTLAAVDAYMTAKNAGTPKGKILSNFNKIKYKYRSKIYAIYKQDQSGERLIDIIHLGKGTN